LSVIAAGLILLVSASWRNYLMPHLVSFAIGALLGAAFLALMPHALTSEGGDPHTIFMVVLGGILLFFLLEKLVLWRHCHSEHCSSHSSGNTSHVGSMVLIGDGLHNFVDGILIAAAFLTDEHLGIVTAMAVASHEIPQELGDFVVLLHSGFSRKKALIFNVLSSLTTVVGGVLAYYALQEMMVYVPYILALAASSFIYIAVADLIPGLHKETHPKATSIQMGLIMVGIAVVALAHSTLH
jgi:zinc and cadmium transporter